MKNKQSDGFHSNAWKTNISSQLQSNTAYDRETKSRSSIQILI
jgi:hypothetical protein